MYPLASSVSPGETRPDATSHVAIETPGDGRQTFDTSSNG